MADIDMAAEGVRYLAFHLHNAENYENFFVPHKVNG